MYVPEDEVISERRLIYTTNLDNFDSDVIDASRETLVLVDIWAQWCAPCITLSPVLERVIAECQGQLVLAKVDVDEGENMKIAGRYRVRGFPTVLLFKDTKEQARFHSAQTLSFIREFLAPYLNP